MDTLLQELIEFVKNASPVLWAIYVKQAYVDGVYALITGIVLACLGLVLLLVGLHLRKKEQEKDVYDDDNGAYWAAIVFGVLAIGGGIAIACTSIGNFINPEYQAIQLIIQTLK